MTKEYQVQVVKWCKTCQLSALTNNKEQTCVFCQGQLKEIGWVENNEG